MAIRTVVTRGYGNGTFDGTIADVVRRGYIAGAAVEDDSGTRRQRQIKSIIHTHRHKGGRRRH